MATSQEIKSIHRKLTTKLGRKFKIFLSLEPPKIVAWKKVSKGTVISFNIFSKDDFQPTDFAIRKRGGRCPVFPVKPFDEFGKGLWAGWQEEWVCQGGDHFDLKGAGWTFFWDIMGKDEKIQILRAEWDQINFQGGHAPQPHWHVDTEFMIPFQKTKSNHTYLIEGSSELEEISISVEHSTLEELQPPFHLQDVYISGMHLGMGGWQNQSSHPACWQRSVNGQWVELIVWAERVLSSAIHQFDEMKLGDFV